MLNVDQFFNARSGFFARLFLSILSFIFLRGHKKKRSAGPVPVTITPSEHMDGLQIFTRGEGPAPDQGVLVGTVRMGYGHHRVAASACSYALARGVPTYLYDLLAIDCPESELIAGIDQFYSRWSRRASDVGGPVEWLWGRAMSRGNLNSLRFSCRMAEQLKAIMASLPPTLPIITSYPLNGQMALACGFKRVVNLVVDNYPQYFLLVPGAINLVQSPSYYTRLREMGVPAKFVEFGGHWVHHDIVSHLPTDSAARLCRVAENRPRRVVLPIGGAGAQKKYVSALLARIAAPLEQRKLRLLLNTGDHQGIAAALLETIKSLGIDHQVIDGQAGLERFCAAHDLSGDEPQDERPITVFRFTSHFEAFSATDRLVRVSDILATKPSELAFCPIPKLHLRRVGDHEAASAMRSTELGDGSYECRTVEQAAEVLSFFCDEPDLLTRMNEAILRNNEQGLYSGAKVAVDLALM